MKVAREMCAGILAEEVVDAMPQELEALADRLVRWGIIPRPLRPDSAIINVYEVGECIPPHIDHHDFVRPFVTLSLLSEEPIMFGAQLFPLSPGNFGGSHHKIHLPPGGAPSLCPGGISPWTRLMDAVSSACMIAMTWQANQEHYPPSSSLSWTINLFEHAQQCRVTHLAES